MSAEKRRRKLVRPSDLDEPEVEQVSDGEDATREDRERLTARAGVVENKRHIERSQDTPH